MNSETTFEFCRSYLASREVETQVDSRGSKGASILIVSSIVSLLVCLYCDSYYGRLGARATLWTNQMGYNIIVIARLPGIYGDVNRPCPRVGLLIDIMVT